MLPVGGGLLYIEPVYLQATGGEGVGSYPTVQRVFVTFNGRIGYAPTLQAGARPRCSPGCRASPPPPTTDRRIASSMPRSGFSTQAEASYKDAQAGAEDWLPLPLTARIARR